MFFPAYAFGGALLFALAGPFAATPFAFAGSSVRVIPFSLAVYFERVIPFLLTVSSALATAFAYDCFCNFLVFWG